MPSWSHDELSVGEAGPHQDTRCDYSYLDYYRANSVPRNRELRAVKTGRKLNGMTGKVGMSRFGLTK